MTIGRPVISVGAMTRRDPSMRAFLGHLAVFVVVTTGLAILNVWRSPKDIWFVWVLAGWGIGIAAHYLALELRKRGRRDPRLADRNLRSFYIHLFVYVAVGALLIVVNVTQSPHEPWSIWPLIAWGAGLTAHGYAVFRSRGARRRKRTTPVSRLK